jgi:hypothetical protein
MPDFTYVCPWVETETEEGTLAFFPKVHQYHQTWRAVDGRTDPALPGGVAVVEALDVPGNVHSDIIADPDIDQLTPANVAAQSQAHIGQSHGDVPSFVAALRERRGDDNPDFKAAQALLAATDRGTR